MLLYSYYDSDTGIRITESIEYKEEEIEKSRKKFKELKDEGIIISGNFEDSKWLLTNEVHTTTLNIEFDEILYNKEAKKRNMYTYKQFVNSVKSYAVLNIKKKSMGTTRQYLHLFKKYTIATNYFNEKKSKNGLDTLGPMERFAPILQYTQGYLQYTNFDGTEYYISLLDELIDEALALARITSGDDKRRSLSDFQSMMLFDRIIEDFWKRINNNSNKELKEFYFPLYLWWKITNIIPLRLTEFCVTPYDCIEESSNGKFYIYLRRTALKGNKKGQRRYVSYKLDEDYKIYKYVITKEIADLIKEYQEITKGNRTDYNRLICYITYIKRAQPYGDKIDSNSPLLDRNFSRESLQHLRDRFLTRIVQDEYNYEILESDKFIEERTVGIEDNETVIVEFKPLKDSQISAFRLGDIRHYAMINLVLSDVSPILIRELVDHEDINTSFHYFGNTSELVKCMSYIKYKEICKKEYDRVGKNKDNITIERILNQLEYSESIEIDNGRCISKYFISGQLNDCIPNDGECENCDFFIQEKTIDKETQKLKLKIIESRIDKEADLIANLLSSYKNTPKINKDLIQNTLRLQNSIKLYCDESVKNGGIIWGN